IVLRYSSSTSMPGKIYPCILCERKSRQSRSNYTQICTIEREEKIREAYQIRYNEELRGTLLNELVHSKCYKSLVSNMELVSVVNRTGRSKRKKNCSSSKSSPVNVLKDITNNLTAISSRFNASSTKITDKIVCRDKYPSENTTECSAIEIPILCSSITIDRPISSNNISFAQVEQNINSTNSTEISFIASDMREETFTFELPDMPMNTWDDVYAEEDYFTNSTSIESIEIDSIDLTTTTSIDETSPQLTLNNIRATDSNVDDLSILMANIDEYSDEIIIPNGFKRKARNSPKRIRRKINTDLFKRRLRRIIKRKPLPLYHEYSVTNGSYSNSFEELCVWLLSVLHDGFVVALKDIAKQYEDILNRHQEKITLHMLRTTSIRDRLMNKFGDRLCFDKLSNLASLWVKDRNRKNISGSLPPSTIAFQEHCLRSSRQIKIWLDALEPFLIAPAMFRNGYDYSNTQDKMKIKWSTLNAQLTDYRLETCGECKGSCTRCKCYKNNLSCTVFCKCNQDMCYNRNIYGSSSQQLKNKFDKLQVTTSLMQYNRNDEMSTKSDLIYLNDTDINESHSDMALDKSNIDPEVTYSDSNVTSTPTGRRLSSATVKSDDDQSMIQSPYAHSTPISNQVKNEFTLPSFKTPSLPITSTPRRRAQFRKCFGKKTNSQPNMN
ncbi:unnamed protein product, partial [Rotaria magnacalcarata]